MLLREVEYARPASVQDAVRLLSEHDGARALAGVAAHRSLVPVLAELGPEHFDGELHRRLHAQLLGGGVADDPALVGLVAELDARAVAEGIDERTAEELLLRLRERRIRRDLIDAGPERTLELQAALAKIRSAVEQLATAQSLSG